MCLKAVIEMLKISGFDFFCFFRNLYLNFFCKAVCRDDGSFLFVYPHVFVAVDDSAKMILHGNLYLGQLSLQGCYQKSKFILRKNAIFVVNQRCEILDSFDVQVYENGIFCVDSFHSNIDLEVSCGEKIELKGEVIAGRHVRIKDFNGHYVSYKGYPKSAPIVIENHVWICTGSCINPGVIIGSGSVVSDNSNVVSSIPQQSFVIGNPANVVASNIEWKK